MSDSAPNDAKDARDRESRAADTDRIQIAQLLAYAAEQGRLQLKDYEDRLTRAYAATTYEELDRLRADLPGAPVNPRRGGKTNPAPSTLLLALLSGQRGNVLILRGPEGFKDTRDVQHRCDVGAVVTVTQLRGEAGLHGQVARRTGGECFDDGGAVAVVENERALPLRQAGSLQ